MSHSSSQWSHVDSNVRKGKDLVTQDTSVSEEKANKLTNKKVEKLQEAAEPPAQEEIRLEGTSPTPSTSKPKKPRKKRQPALKKEENEVEWKEGFRHVFKPYLNKSDMAQIIHILERLESTNEFILAENGSMYYKGKFLGNSILSFYYLFKNDINRKRVAKHVNMLRKLMAKLDISVHV
jgi:hypothetical protein